MDTKLAPLTFQEIILKLQHYWADFGCAILQPMDLEMGAGTFHPATFLRALGPEPWAAAYVQPCRRPSDGRYGENPNRTQHYYQFQVMIKPAPLNIQELYLESLRQLGIDTTQEDIRFVEDNWESPTLGAWGIGWEVWLNGMEASQFTYFQQVGGIDCNPVTAELTYGLERIAMHLQGINNCYEIVWSRGTGHFLTYGDLFRQNEVEMSQYNFKLAPVEELSRRFVALEVECRQLLDQALVVPAYEAAIRASHIFNLMDARGAISVAERQNYILRVRTLTKQVAETFYTVRQAQNFPYTGEKSDTLN